LANRETVGLLPGGTLALATHVPFGQQVLPRGIAFMDLAIAQVEELGQGIDLDRVGSSVTSKNRGRTRWK
jgi:hypothetical protein